MGIKKSAFEKLEIKYQGREYSRQTNSSIQRITFIGSQQDVMDAYESKYNIGGTIRGLEEYGEISSLELSQDAGPFWLLVCEFSKKDNDGEGCDNAELQIGVLTMPIETHPNYKMCWNHYLWCTIAGQKNPSFAWADATMKDDKIPNASRYPKDYPTSPLQSPFYCWGKTISECTPLPPGYCWYPCQPPKKPGVISYTIPTITVSMKGYVTQLSKTYWIMEYSEGRIYSQLPSSKGATKEVRDYLSKINEKYSNPSWTADKKRNWRVQGTNIYAEKDSYNYSLNFMLSGPGGWDTDIYSSN